MVDWELQLSVLLRSGYQEFAMSLFGIRNADQEYLGGDLVEKNFLTLARASWPLLAYAPEDPTSIWTVLYYLNGRPSLQAWTSSGDEPCLGDEIECTAACYAGGHKMLLVTQEAWIRG